MTWEDRVAQILGEWQEQRELGHYVEVDDLCAQHPTFADELRLRLAALDVIEQAYAEKRIFQGRAPKRLGEYEIVRELGRGGMGVVYEAVQTTMDRTVALKVLFPSVTTSARAVKRFQREARAAGRVQHTNIVPIYSLGDHSGTWYYAMEFVQGMVLSALLGQLRALGDIPGEEHRTLLGTGLESAPSEPATYAASATTSALTTSHGTSAYYRDVARLFADVADGLQAAHDAGVIHRDIKPSNLIFDEKGVLKIVDFGIARIGDDAGGMTMTGEMLGTPIYMSPEQARAKTGKIDHRTDVYSLGASLYELLTLRTPFSGESFAEVYKQILTTVPLAPRRHATTIPRDLETVVMKAMEKEPGQRYASAGAMSRDLRAYAEGFGIKARRVGPAARFVRLVKRNQVRSALTAACVLAIAAAGVLGWKGARQETRRAELEYDSLLGDIDRQSIEIGRRTISRSRSIAMPVEVSAPLARAIQRAIDFDPARPEALLRRALLLDRSHGESLADLDAAETRGASRRTTELARALILLWDGDPKASAAAEVRAASGPASQPIDAYLLAAIQVRRNEWRAAQASLDELLRSAESGSLERRGALKLRASVRKRLGDRFGAIEDLTKLEEQGGASTYARIELAWLWHGLGRKEVAEAAFGRQLEVAAAATDPDAWVPLIRATTYAGAAPWRERATRSAVEAHPDSARLQRLRCAALSASNRRPAALAAAERAVELAPNDVEALRRRGDARFRSRYYWGALMDAQAVRRLRPDEPRFVENEAWALLRLGRRHAARDLFKKLPDVASRRAFDWRSRASVLQALDEDASALGAIDRAIELHPFDFEGHFARAHLLRKLDRAVEATTVLRTLLKREGLDATQLARIASSLASLGHYDEALAATDRGLALDPDEPQLHYVPSWIFMKQERAQEAIDRANRALELDPGLVRAQQVVRHFAKRRGGWEGVLEVVDGWLVKHPDDARLLFDRVRLLEELGRIDDAASTYETLCDLEPWNADALIGRAAILMRLGRMAEGRELGTTALERAPDDPFIMTAVAGGFVSAGRKTEALPLLDRAIKLDPENVEAHAFRAAARLEADPEGALADARRAVELGPKHYNAWLAMSRALFRLGNREAALDAAKKAYDLGPDFEIVAAHYAHLLSDVGETARALEVAQAIHAKLPHSLYGRAALATALSAVQRLDEALPLYESVYKDAPTPTHVANYALALMRSGQAGRALELLEQAAQELDPIPMKIASTLPLVLAWNRRYEDAIEALASVETRRQLDYTTYMELSRPMEGAPPEVSLRFFERMARSFPKRTPAKTELANALVRAGRKEDASRVADEALEIVDRTDPVNLGLLYESLSRVGRTSDASALFSAMEKAVRVTLLTASPGLRALVRYHWAVVVGGEAQTAVQSGDPARAKVLFDQAIRDLKTISKEPQRPTLAKSFLARFHSAYGKLPSLEPADRIEHLAGAIDGFRELASAGWGDPQWARLGPSHYLALSEMLRSAGRHDEAHARLAQLREHLAEHVDDEIQRSLWIQRIQGSEFALRLVAGEIEPDTPLAHMTLGSALFGQGEYPRALRHLELALNHAEVRALQEGIALYHAALAAAGAASQSEAEEAAAALRATAVRWMAAYVTLHVQLIEKDPSPESRAERVRGLRVFRSQVLTAVPIFEALRDLPEFVAAVNGSAQQK